MTNLTHNKLRDSIELAELYFNKAADEWTTGNNSGDNDTYERCLGASNNYQTGAERILKPLGVTVDYPGLYPIYHYQDNDYYDAQILIRAILTASEAL